MLSFVRAATVHQSTITPVTIETEVCSRGLPEIRIIGLASKTVQESKDRVRSALRQSGFKLPAKKIIVNLFPSEISKYGNGTDVAIALSLLRGYGCIQSVPNDMLFYGALSLDGSIRPTPGLLAVAVDAAKQGCTSIVFSKQQLSEVRYLKEIQLLPVQTLSELVKMLQHAHIEDRKPEKYVPHYQTGSLHHFLQTYVGQQYAIRAAMICGTGKHHMLFTGTPGIGKTMLASHIDLFFPPLTYRHALESASQYSLFHLQPPLFGKPPLRVIHHTASVSQLIGMHTSKKAPELLLANHGILVMDELPLFQTEILRAIPLPLEHGTISEQSDRTRSLQCETTLIATMNPCPCGYAGSEHPCSCNGDDIRRYRAKIRGPLADRIDLHVQLQTYEAAEKGMSIHAIQDMIQRMNCATEKQQKRYESTNISANGKLTSENIDKFCQLRPAAKQRLDACANRFHFSKRRYVGMIRVARTCADLDDENLIEKEHIEEAAGFGLRDQEFERNA